ncbi:MAG: alpha/beta fold hydrolase, partial [Planctomycetes bacterium]|nr:alpha/beta fold hydrolase [Planctomycetota bacterium]
MLRKLLFAYLAVLLVSHTVSLMRGNVKPQDKQGVEIVELPRRTVEQETVGTMQVGFRDIAADTLDAPTVLLVHGSPGDGDTFLSMVEELRGKYRLIIPDLPGFGSSERVLEDYSMISHGYTLVDLLEKLRIEEVHAVGFSMGGGVVLSMADHDPNRIDSITMMAAIGVQELEMFGKYELNHALHGFQLLALRTLSWVFPHFGALRKGNSIRNYARNFYDSDLRPLRTILQSWHGPMLVVHGEKDVLVPVTAAREHLRIVPHAESEIWEEVSHFLPWRKAEETSTAISGFIDRVEGGNGRTRDKAEEPAIVRATEPFDPTAAPQLAGLALVMMLLLLSAATLVSEDLTCIFTGVLVAQGSINFLLGTGACFLGILVGDGLLFLLGRWLGRPALARAPLRWIVRPRAVYRASAWFEHKGGKAILLSRFLPGLRLPTYVAAGILGQNLRTFFFYFVFAGLLWTPILVGISTWATSEVLEIVHVVEGYALPILVLLAFSILCAQKIILPLFTYRGRRLAYGSWRRKFEWEFWPPQVFYLPVLLQVICLAIRHGGLRVVTAVNPGIPTGGLIGESKWQILQALGVDPKAPRGARGPAADALPLSLLISGRNETTEQRLTQADQFLKRHNLSYPVVLKPDRGERGHGVEIIRNRNQMDKRLRIDRTDLLLQEFVSGIEFGVFYVREPGARQGEILSINGKQLLKLCGDGKRCLEQLIIDDDRAVCQAEVHFEYHAERLYKVPAKGEVVHLVEVGAHSRGTLFLDRRDLKTNALLTRIDEISSTFPGFSFGRFDLRAPSEEALQSGKGLRILELNGLTAEVAHIYDPKISLLG